MGELADVYTELRKTNDALHEMNLTFSTFVETAKASNVEHRRRLDYHATKLEKHDQLLHGDGPDSTGMVTDVRLLRDAEKKRNTREGVLWAGVVFVSLKAVWDFVRNN